MVYIEFLIVFAAGISLFFSTCMFPLLPAYIAQLIGKGAGPAKMGGSRGKVAFHTGLFLLGYLICLMILGGIAGWIGNLFFEVRDPSLKTSGLALIIFGFLLTGLLNVKLFMKGRKKLAAFSSKGIFGSFLSGMLFSMQWTPGTGLLSISILLLAAASASWTAGAALLAVFALGIAVPFFIFSILSATSMDAIRFINRHLGKITFVTGMLLLLLGFLIFSGQIEATHSLISTAF
ncbi:cytochrome c biogenesis CcdA family protein [Bacillus testis]|uniref:cytochrome c biogenesis CcdA family protein n=1 Tax=Bacillus testis TaxID=1622072 RepID=UPI00067F3F50|nr:cytochrome c biogenesis CcdA family protein [Bacillus testis]